MSPLLGIDLIHTNENFAIKGFSEQVGEIFLMTVELPTPQKTLEIIQITDIMVSYQIKDIHVSLFKSS